MQKGPSQITSGNIAPTISGPKKDKDVLVVSGLIVGLAIAIGAFWYYSSTEHYGGQDQLNGSQVNEGLKNNQTSVTPVSLPVSRSQEAAGTTNPGILHTDLYLEVGRNEIT